jgi:hypothetical protein
MYHQLSSIPGHGLAGLLAGGEALPVGVAEWQRKFHTKQYAIKFHLSLLRHSFALMDGHIVTRLLTTT